jgi:death-on-curing protein
VSLSYPTVDEVLSLHERIVERGDDTEPGVARRGDISYALTFVEDGHYGHAPATIHEKAAHLMRLLVANHPFVDGNKRTALATVTVFYGLNGYDLDYDDDVREHLKSFATDERSVDVREVVAYLRRHAEPPEGDGRSRHNGFTDETGSEK